MRNFHDKQKPSYFEGWYLKHQKNHQSLSLIPAFHRNEKGEPSASIQVITDKLSRYLSFPAEEFSVSPSRFHVRIGKNIFSEKGILIDIDLPDLKITGKLSYGPITPLRSDIMGPFALLGSMQCNHGIVSLTHRIRGSLTINGETLDFTDGTGYIEKDWGTSFPRSYLWTQCCWHETEDNSLMISLASIPIGRHTFTGCICSIWYNHTEYRLATYLGVKIKTCTNQEITLKQGKYLLKANITTPTPTTGHELKAPISGNMHRSIREQLRCRIQYQFYHDTQPLFNHTSTMASLETVR